MRMLGSKIREAPECACGGPRSGRPQHVHVGGPRSGGQGNEVCQKLKSPVLLIA